VKGLLVGLLVAGLVLSCSVGGKRADVELQNRIAKMNEITALWTQIREFRADMHMDLEPKASTMIEFVSKTVQDARKVCADNHRVPATCTDTCTLSDHICENAELICKIADELGQHDRAQEKCTSGKASCREAKQRCCNCSGDAP